jgi:hypothetical protein
MPIIPPVTYDQLIKHYGSQKLAGEALKAIDGHGVKQSSVHEWKTRGRIPHPRQCQYEVLTKGVLKADRPYRRAA